MPTEVTFNPRFGKYVLLKRIAKGGMAEIFRGMTFGAEGFRKTVAVKRMLPFISEDAEYVDMFIHEARLAARLNHANIVQILDFGSINSMLYQAMEYVHGRNVQEIISKLKSRQLAPPVIPPCYILIQALYGLDHAHRLRDASGQQLNLVHRDISPSNIMVSYEGQVKVADFGIAKTAQSNIQTVAGNLKGKYSYMSPEQAQGAKLDQRSDLFSLGICFYEMLTLRSMYSGVNELQLLKKVETAEYIPPRQINPHIPERLEEILGKALQRNPDDRYSSAGEWLEVMEEFMVKNQMPSSSTRLLSNLMKDTFHAAMQLDQENMAQEASMAEELFPGESQIDLGEDAGQSNLETVVVKREDLKIPGIKKE
jgi:serine/threonine protein kinase